METNFVMNNFGVFRIIHKVIEEVFRNSGGIDAMKFSSKTLHTNQRIYSNTLDSESLCEYFKSIWPESKLVGVGIYSDGTTISINSSQFLRLIQIRVVNAQNDSYKKQEFFSTGFECHNLSDI